MFHNKLHIICINVAEQSSQIVKVGFILDLFTVFFPKFVIKTLTNYVEIYLRSLESPLIQLLCKYTPDVGRDYEISTHIDIVDA